MWPRTLDMSMDECRIMMRKLELETYGSIISTFRAHGLLDQKRLSILSELREILKIDPDRHRSETRRATNDEQLTTIADKLYGDDFIIQWTREGKRGAPLLCRSKPYTSLTIAANAASEWVRKINIQLPEPRTVKRILPSTPLAPAVFPSPDSNVVLRDPSRAAPLPRPISIHPHLLDDVRVHRNAVAAVDCARDVTKSRKTVGRREAKRRILGEPPAKITAIGGWSENKRDSDRVTTKATSKRGKLAMPESSRKRTASLPLPPPTQLPIPSRTTATTTTEPLWPREGVRQPLHQLPKSKKDVTSNASKVNRLAYQIYPPTTTTVPATNPPVPQVQLRKPERSVPKPTKVLNENLPVQCQQQQQQHSLSNNGPILFNHLQRKTLSSSQVTPTPATFTSQQLRLMSGDRDSDRSRISQNGECERMELVDDLHRDLIKSESSTIILDETTGHRVKVEEHEIVINQVEEEECEENVLMEISDDKIIFDMNESSEIIVEDSELEECVAIEDSQVFGFTDFIGCENGTITTTATTEVEGNGTDFEYLLDHVDAEDNQILVEEVDANGYSQIRKANLMELMVAGQIPE